ncbi:hypothetical protein DLEV_025 [Diachasmimorpha longicaudata entomopoxvirus]|uniref:Uncharacterized protein n=1 Tax=Diachasmimorpha longicaudata entomopoxvirus TaxID=109981 RepID=A0A7R5WNL1_9POXV|nr:hypothetical protein QKK69_gp025 [Diachasmimorpha longicaudata entomopoxvirus]AKS26316.1 hypothetical protein DLEV_025 [Diachasmimorpha longicaudata entomopoxvirus]
MARKGFYNKLEYKNQKLQLYVIDEEFFANFDNIKNVLSIPDDIELRDPHYRIIKDENIDNKKYLTNYGLYYLHFLYYQADFEKYLLETLFPTMEKIVKRTKVLSGDDLYFPFVSDNQIKKLQEQAVKAQVKKRQQLQRVITKKFPGLSETEKLDKEKELIIKNKTFEIFHRHLTLHTTKPGEFIKYFNETSDD